uniref:ATP synthase complex subunit 8 n=1 Tax=Pterolophia sp. ZJY-2019 TaxID=2604362 RepID=A0A5B9RFM5_9CUCU|nr:ATP synthase F0 subunit 8 [Pterolophia sp. ZJY-2019]QEG58696.1 ATP synthase F0 subunit 8 [Pterolophia sp. ZJY-2019]
MPQMAPLNWLTLFIFFIFLFMIFNIKNYYIIFYTPKVSLTKKKLLKFNWKW